MRLLGAIPGAMLGTILVGAAALSGAASAAGVTQFWNLTSGTITSLSLAPAGTSAFGPDQCPNDKDGEVEHDERLKLTGVEAGRYDVRVSDKKGRVCVAHDVEVKGTGRVAFLAVRRGPEGLQVGREPKVQNPHPGG